MSGLLGSAPILLRAIFKDSDNIPFSVFSFNFTCLPSRFLTSDEFLRVLHWVFLRMRLPLMTTFFLENSLSVKTKKVFTVSVYQSDKHTEKCPSLLCIHLCGRYESEVQSSQTLLNTWRVRFPDFLLLHS